MIRKPLSLLKRIYIWSTGYSYTNLGRLFLRLFLGLMLLQFGVRQAGNFAVYAPDFPAVIGLSSEATLTLMIIIEIASALFIMTGFLTRIMLVLPFIAMTIAEYYLLHDKISQASYELDWIQPVYLPVMFLGIIFFLILVGPGKISVDYFLSLHIIHTEDRSEAELEEV